MTPPAISDGAYDEIAAVLVDEAERLEREADPAQDKAAAS